MMAAAFERILDIAEWDRETKRILNLSIPFCLAAVTSGLFETVRVALVANFIGTDAVAAYTIVLLVLGLTQEFFGGFALTSASLCSQAIGRGNHKLAGEYVQISCVFYTVCFIPNIVVWMFFTDDVARLFGFNETTVKMAQDYARYFVIGQWFGGLDEAYGSLVADIEHERFVTSMTVAKGLFSTCTILTSVLTGPTTLSDVGIIEMSTEALFFGFSLVITNMAGWMTKYTQGMFRTNALRSKVAVRTVFRTAVPLAFGQLLQYGEWEILTIFIAALGTAEVTTWGIVGSLWDTLEALTEGFGDAGEIRVV
jgi:Na+-driven multidrug efflux pump